MACDLWRVVFRFVLPTFMKMPFETTVWSIGWQCWVGVLASVALGKPPIDRLLVTSGPQTAPSPTLSRQL
jgi:hypothetical protein